MTTKSAAQLREELAALQQQLDEVERIEQLANQQKKAAVDIAVVAAFKAAFSYIRTNCPDILGEALSSIPQQALPREANIAKKVELSETEAHNAKELGRKVIAGLQ